MGIKKFLLGDYSEVGLNNKLSREDWVSTQLLKIPENETIIDVGAGELKYKKFCSHLIYQSQDLGEYDGKGDGNGIQLGEWDTDSIDIYSDITSIPVRDNEYDNVLCSEVLEHVPYPTEAFEELVRILKIGGKLIITVPFNSLTHFAPFHYYTGYSSYLFEKWAEDFGLEILELSTNGNYFEYLAQELRYMLDVNSKYSNIKVGIKEKIAQRILLSFLKKASLKGEKSSELLSYGVQFVAIKSN